MKKYSTLLLSSAILLTSLAQQPIALANTEAGSAPITTSPASDPIRANSPITTQQNGNNLSLFYERSEPQKSAKIRYAIWSDADGQDDIQWYVAGDQQTDISLGQHSGAGNYTVHAYITIDNKFLFLAETSFTVSENKNTAPLTPTATVTPLMTTSISEPGFLDIHVHNLPVNTTEVKLPVWSLNNGQDDLTWYTAQKNTDGSYSYRVSLKNHQYDTGKYAIHAYVKTSDSSNLSGLTNTEALVEENHIPTQATTPVKTADPIVSVSNLQKESGTYRVNLQPVANGKAIKSVEVATWSDTNQSNLKWRTATLKNGLYSIKVDFQEHQNRSETYHNHIYVTYTDGSRVGFVTETVDLSNTKLPVAFTKKFIAAGQVQVTFSNIYNETAVRYAVWSDENGQDDLKWYDASSTSSQTFSGNILLSNHKGVGTYHVHVYGKTGLGAFTMNIAQSERVTPTPNTYPVGQCTWGVKELAPWVQNYWGNGAQWARSARNAGFRTGTTPVVGAIAVWEIGTYGHVAYVTEVSSATRIRVKEANYAGKQYISDFRGWFNPVSDGVTAYIYPN